MDTYQYNPYSISCTNDRDMIRNSSKESKYSNDSAYYSAIEGTASQVFQDSSYDDTSFYQYPYASNYLDESAPSNAGRLSENSLRHKSSSRETLSSLGWAVDTSILQIYKFVAQKGREPYFELLPGCCIAPGTPARVYLDPTRNAQKHTFPCQYPGCNKEKIFKRPADLERHYKNVHTTPDQKEQCSCDYPPCQKDRRAFPRRDHLRDHLRYFHKEDIECAKGEKARDKNKSLKLQEAWVAERKIVADWWRCPKCLQRVQVAKSGYECQLYTTGLEYFQYGVESSITYPANCAACADTIWIWNADSRTWDACLNCQPVFHRFDEDWNDIEDGGPKEGTSYNGILHDVQQRAPETYITNYKTLSNSQNEDFHGEKNEGKTKSEAERNAQSKWELAALGSTSESSHTRKKVLRSSGAVIPVANAIEIVGERGQPFKVDVTETSEARAIYETTANKFTSRDPNTTLTAKVKGWLRRNKSSETEVTERTVRSEQESLEPRDILKPLHEQRANKMPPATDGLEDGTSPMSEQATSQQPRYLQIGEVSISPKLDQVGNTSQASCYLDENSLVAGRRTTSQDSFSSAATCLEDETDWADDSDGEDLAQDMLNRLRISSNNENGYDQGLLQAVIDPAKAELINRIMDEFWILFNQDWVAGMTQISPDSTSESNSISMTSSNQSTTSSNLKHSRERKVHPPSNEDENSRSSKRPRILASPSDDLNEKLKFACPYRKHDPRKFNIRDWSSCALTPHKTVARVKGHLYRYHAIYQCARCKDLFKTQEGLDNHIEAIQGCEAKVNSDRVDGITSKIKERLQCRKKAHPGETEPERWKNIYNVLFPNEDVPSPYFDHVQDDQDPRPQSPGSREVTNYEEYLRSEVPRLVRSALTTVVNNEVEPIEERLRGQIVTLIEEAQNRAFCSYRAMHGSAGPSILPRSREGTNSVSSMNQPPIPENILDTFYQPPPPQTQPETAITFPELGIPLQRSNTNSDSGYASNRSASGSTSQAQVLTGRMDTSTSDPIIPQVDLPEPVLFSDEALDIPDAFFETSLMADMNYSDWNETPNWY